METNMTLDNKMNWSKDTVFEFLDLYESEPTIWNPQHPSHKNRKDVFDAWCRIQKQMSNKFSVDELKRKKDSLMATYRFLVVKIRKSVENGLDIYQPNWFAFDKMAKFLNEREPKKRFIKIESIDVQPDDVANNDDYFDFEENFDETREEFDETLTNNMNDASLASMEDTSPRQPAFSYQSVDNLHQSQQTYLRKRKREMLNESNKFFENAITHLNKSTLTEEFNKDESELYGQLLAVKLRKFDELTRDVAMNKIDNIIFDLKMKSNHQTSNTLDSNKSVDSS